MRILILSATTGYQLRAFNDAAETLGIELAFATDRCKGLDDPWRDRAIPVRFHDAATSLQAVERAAMDAPLGGVIAVGDRPVVLAAHIATRFGLRGNTPEAARITTSKLLTREALDRAGLPVPWFYRAAVDSDVEDALPRADFPCVVKPLAMAASRGVIRADDEAAFRDAFERVRALLVRRDVRIQRNEAHGSILVEGYIPGAEYALEGVLHGGDLQALALFDKPDPLEGPVFEETIYVTPSRLDADTQHRVIHTIAAACRAIGLREGPIHAEARVNSRGVYVLEVAARPIGGLCARALRFRAADAGANAADISLEALLLLHATGHPVDGYRREDRASGVMMCPVPRRGVFKRVEGIEEARRIDGVEDIVITAKPDEMLVPLPEGASYPGFIFAKGALPADAEAALRRAHAALTWVIERPIDVLSEPSPDT